MSNEANLAFEHFLKFVSSTELRATQRLPLEAEIRVFIRETLCDHDRRAKDHEIKSRWLAFVQRYGPTGLFDTFRKQSLNSWTEIEKFCSVYVYPVQPTAKPIPPKTMKTDEFFMELERRVSKIQIVTENEKLALFYILKYLKTEALRGGMHIDQAAISKAWKDAKPILEKLKLLEDFKKDDRLRSSLKLFIFRKM